jgi:hypothetical protein
VGWNLSEALQPLEDLIGLESIVGIAKSTESNVFRLQSLLYLVPWIPDAALKLPFTADFQALRILHRFALTNDPQQSGTGLAIGDPLDECAQLRAHRFKNLFR